MHTEDLFEDAGHSTEVEYNLVGKLAKIWCPKLDEEKVVVGSSYLRHCPMCGEEVNIEE